MRPVNRFLEGKSIALICQKYKAKYVMDSCLKYKDGGWVNFPAVFFYTEEKHPEGSNYFAMHRGYDGVDPDMHWMITDGICITEGIHNGILFDDGELVHSRYRHDYYEHRDTMVDGGRDYFRHRIVDGAKPIKFKIEDGNIVEA